MNNTKYDSKKSSLTWRDKNNKKVTFPAGVAFHEAGHGDYRLKVDMFSQSRRFYLKPSSHIENKTVYRVEVIDNPTQGKGRKTVGTGLFTDTGSIEMTIPPFNKNLVLKVEK